MLKLSLLLTSILAISSYKVFAYEYSAEQKKAQISEPICEEFALAPKVVPLVTCEYKRKDRSSQYLKTEFNKRLYGNSFHTLERCITSDIGDRDPSSSNNCGEVMIFDSGRKLSYSFRVKDEPWREAHKNAFKYFMKKLDVTDSTGITFDIRVDTFLVDSNESDSTEFSLYADYKGALPEDLSKLKIAEGITLNGGNLISTLLGARFSKLKMNSHMRTEKKWTFTNVEDGIPFFEDVTEPLNKVLDLQLITDQLKVQLNGTLTSDPDYPGYVKPSGLFFQLSRLSQDERGLVIKFSDSTPLPKRVPLDTPIFVTSASVSQSVYSKESCWLFCSNKNQSEKSSVYEVYLTIITDDIKKVKTTDVEKTKSTMQRKSTASQDFDADFFKYINSLNVEAQGINKLYESDFAHKLVLKTDSKLYKSDFLNKTVEYRLRLMKDLNHPVRGKPFNYGYINAQDLISFNLPSIRIKDVLSKKLDTKQIHFSVEFIINKKSYTYVITYYPDIKKHNINNDDIIRPLEPKNKSYSRPFKIGDQK